jgi:hypothetical protein
MGLNMKITGTEHITMRIDIAAITTTDITITDIDIIAGISRAL